MTELFMEQEKQFENDYKDFAALLNKHGVEYLIVGAYATIYHTNISRDTKDIDFWIRKTEQNAENCAKAIKDFCGFEIKIDDLLEDKKIVFIGREPHRIDIFNEQADLDFEEAWRRKKDGKFRDLTVHFIDREDLIKVKKYFSHEQDIKDIHRLIQSRASTNNQKQDDEKKKKKKQNYLSL